MPLKTKGPLGVQGVRPFSTFKKRRPIDLMDLVLAGKRRTDLGHVHDDK